MGKVQRIGLLCVRGVVRKAPAKRFLLFLIAVQDAAIILCQWKEERDGVAVEVKDR